MESYFVPTSIDISETGRQNSFWRYERTSKSSNLSRWVAPNIVMKKVTKAKQTKYKHLYIYHAKQYIPDFCTQRTSLVVIGQRIPDLDPNLTFLDYI